MTRKCGLRAAVLGALVTGVTGAPSAQSSLILPKGVGVPNDLALVEGSGSFHLYAGIQNPQTSQLEVE